MDLVDQRTDSDCLVACTATILRLPYATVPDFVGQWGSEWQGAWSSWLEERGLEVIGFDNHYPRRGLYLADGFTAERPHAHMTVWRGVDLLHDPHPSRLGLSSIRRTWWIMHIDPGGVLRI